MSTIDYMMISVEKQEAVEIYLSDKYLVTLKTNTNKTIKTNVTFQRRSLGLLNQLKSLEYGQAMPQLFDASILYKIGRQLFQFLFSGPIGDYYYEWKKKADGNSRLRLILQMDSNNSPELLDLPWEAINDGDHFTLLNGGAVEFIRSPLSCDSKDDRAIIERTRILVIISNPLNLNECDMLNTEHEVGIFYSQLNDTSFEDKFDIHIMEAVSIESLKEMVHIWKPHILHFVGHGSYDNTTNESYLTFEDDNGLATNIPSSEIVEAVTKTETIQLVFLNACETAVTSYTKANTGIAWKLSDAGIPAVLAMRSRINDQIAGKLTHFFYDGLFTGLSIAEAASNARIRIASNPLKPNPAFISFILLQSSFECIRFKNRLDRKEHSVKETPLMELCRERECRYLQKLINECNNQLIFILGPKGVGKTTLLKKVVLSLANKGTFASHIHLNCSLQNLKDELSKEISRNNTPSIIHIEPKKNENCSAFDFVDLSKLVRTEDRIVVDGVVTLPFPEGSKYALIPEISRIEIGSFIKQHSSNVGFDAINDIYTHVGGNPEIIEKLLSSLEDCTLLEESQLKRFLSNTLIDWSIDDKYSRLPSKQKTILRLLSVFRDYIFRPAAEKILPHLLLEINKSCSKIFDNLIAEGWLIPASIIQVEFLGVPRWLRSFVLSDLSAKEIQRLHKIAANYFSIASSHFNKSSYSASINASYHYEQAGEIFSAWHFRFRELDDMLAIAPEFALKESLSLLDIMPNTKVSWFNTLVTVQLKCTIGHCWKQLGDADKSRDSYTEAIEIARKNLSSSSFPNERTCRQVNLLMADCLGDIAEFNILSKRLDHVQEKLEEAQAIYSKFNDLGGLSRCHLKLAKLFKEAQNNKAFTEHVELSHKYALEEEDYAILSDLHFELGSYYFESDKESDKAKIHLEEALENARKADAPNSLSNSCLLLSKYYLENEIHVERSVSLLNEACAIYQKRGISLGVAQCEEMFAQIHFKYGEIPEGISRLRNAYESYLKQTNREGAKRCKDIFTKSIDELMRLGRVFKKESNYDLAIKYFEAVIAVGRILEVSEKVIEAMYEIGTIKIDQEDHEAASRIFTRCREYGLSHSIMWLATESLHELGLIKLQQKNLVEARQLFESCIEEKQKHRELAAATSTMHMLSVVYMEQNDLEGAYNILKKCLQQDMESKDTIGQVQSMTQLASLLFELKKYKEAKSYATKSLQISEKIHMTHLIVINLYLLGKIAAQDEHYNLAKEYWIKALHIGRDIDAPEVHMIEEELDSL